MTWPAPPPTLDEALAAYAVAVADVIEARRAAEKTAKVFAEARRADDFADGSYQGALKRLSDAAQEVDKAQQRALDGPPPEPEPEPEPPAAEADDDDPLDDDVSYEYAWMVMNV